MTIHKSVSYSLTVPYREREIECEHRDHTAGVIARLTELATSLHSIV